MQSIPMAEPGIEDTVHSNQHCSTGNNSALLLQRKAEEKQERDELRQSAKKPARAGSTGAAGSTQASSRCNTCCDAVHAVLMGVLINRICSCLPGRTACTGLPSINVLSR